MTIQNPCCSETRPHVVTQDSPLTFGSGQKHYMVARYQSAVYLEKEDGNE